VNSSVKGLAGVDQTARSPLREVQEQFWKWRARAAREEESDMNPYATVGSGIGSAEAASLRARLMAWHDTMVAHERRLRSGQTTDTCDDECPHVEARALWTEASAVLGPRANELTFLRSRALGASASSDHLIASAKSVSPEADTERRSTATRQASAPLRSESFIDSPEPSRLATAEV
jgi:hypothetical protein